MESKIEDSDDFDGDLRYTKLYYENQKNLQ